MGADDTTKKRGKHDNVWYSHNPIVATVEEDSNDMRILMNTRYLFPANPTESFLEKHGIFGSGLVKLHMKDDGLYGEFNLDEWNFFVDDMYGAILMLKKELLEKYNRRGLEEKNGVFFSFYGDMCFVNSKEEMKMKCDLEMPFEGEEP